MKTIDEMIKYKIDYTPYIHTCLLLDGKPISKTIVAGLLNGESHTVSIDSVKRVLAYIETLDTHIFQESGYNITGILLDSILNIYNKYGNSCKFYYHGTGFKDKSEVCEIFNNITPNGNVSDNAAKIFHAIYYNSLFNEYSGSIAYLVMLKYIALQHNVIISLNDNEINDIKRTAVYSNIYRLQEVINDIYTKYILSENVRYCNGI